MSNPVEHTPGPWAMQNGGGDTFEINQDTPGLWAAIAATAGLDEGSRKLSLEEAEANARLIAAAPLLLEALKNARNVLAALASGDLKAMHRDSAALAQARAAIAKATDC